jgi:hypothetical protein
VVELVRERRSFLQTGNFYAIARAPSPAMLASVGTLMSQRAKQQAMDEIKDYLANLAGYLGLPGAAGHYQQALAIAERAGAQPWRGAAARRMPERLPARSFARSACSPAARQQQRRPAGAARAWPLAGGYLRLLAMAMSLPVPRVA